MISDAVRRLALEPYRELPVPPSYEWIEQDGVVMVVTPYPSPQIVHPAGVGLDGLETAVHPMREVARARGKNVLGWWVTPEHDELAPALEQFGMVNEDTGGYESVEHSMALVTPPPEPGADGIVVKQVETFEEFAGSAHVASQAFATPPQPHAALAERFADYTAGAEREFIALVDGRIVGSSSAFPAASGVCLFGGSVLPDVRGRGVYRALLRARWDFAVARGTPALTVQAGRMSKPILERLGFVELGAARLFFDTLPD